MRVNAPTWVDWDVRNNLPPDHRDGITAVQQAWATFMHVFTTTIPDLWKDLADLL